MGEIHEFGSFRLDADAKILFRNGEPVPLGRRAVALLQALIEKPGSPLSKSELVEKAWSGLAIEDSNLTVQVSAIRRTLGIEPGGERWIETLSGHGYRFVGPLAARRIATASGSFPVDVASPPAHRDRPSIAVLPFESMESDREQDYFADGIVEEIITALSRFRQLFVIARNSSFTYKSRDVDTNRIRGELGVRYILRGSVRRAGRRIRITGQLIDTESAAHLWVQRFDGQLEDIFDLQDQVTASVVGAVAPRLEEAEIRRAQRKPTTVPDAYDQYLRGLASFHQSTSASIDQALSFFHNAIQCDPQYAAAYGMAAWCHVRRKGSRWATDSTQELREASDMVAKALALGKDDAVPLSSAGYALAYVIGEIEQGSAVLDQAVALNPNLAWAISLCGWPKVWLGELDRAIQLQAQAMRLSPVDPQIFLMECATAFAHLCAGHFDDASVWARRAFNHQPSFIMSLAVLAASTALAGHQREAGNLMDRIAKLDPTLTLGDLSNWTPFRRPEHVETWSHGLRKAGLR